MTDKVHPFPALATHYAPSADTAIENLAVAASRAINAHVNHDGRCAVCLAPFPCPTACLAEANLAVLSEPPAPHIPQLPSRAVLSASTARRRDSLNPCRDLALLNRVLAGLKGLDD